MIRLTGFTLNCCGANIFIGTQGVINKGCFGLVVFAINRR
ncbi:putative deoxyribodipyrimidine photolyase [Vibrio parahaemolyticus AQ3810]|nr:putative deoxyribodipyrimidine photolyase [Vibrio parahaemolyticus EKP-028]EVU13153.1 RNA-binding cryptochrome Cry1 domain protein [Vibrio parahaemolyticus V-223/04]EXF72813.1 putative deoxyribodipyrimidine photolyase [Vibrio parahaemolyticus AQ3810]